MDVVHLRNIFKVFVNTMEQGGVKLVRNWKKISI